MKLLYILGTVLALIIFLLGIEFMPISTILGGFCLIFDGILVALLFYCEKELESRLDWEYERKKTEFLEHFDHGIVAQVVSCLLNDLSYIMDDLNWCEITNSGWGLGTRYQCDNIEKDVLLGMQIYLDIGDGLKNYQSFPIITIDTSEALWSIVHYEETLRKCRIEIERIRDQLADEVKTK